MNNNPIGLFDSGIGGITTLDECRKLMPQENYVYVSDSSNAPYGLKTELEITERADACVSCLLENNCKVIVVACNTATNVAIASLREKYGDIFVGVEPALKPAREAAQGGKIILLCTLATTRQKKFRDLLALCGGENVEVVACERLATQIENNIDNLDILRPQINKILDARAKASCVVLGCTHYVFLTEQINDYYHGEVKIFDGNNGAAKKLLAILQRDNAQSSNKNIGSVKFISL